MILRKITFILSTLQNFLKIIPLYYYSGFIGDRCWKNRSGPMSGYLITKVTSFYMIFTQKSFIDN